jgi:hypothetical protein
VAEKKSEPKPSGDPGRLGTDSVKKSPSPSPKKGDPGRLHTSNVRESRKPESKR